MTAQSETAEQDVNDTIAEVAPSRPAYRNLSAGDPAPWFHQVSTSHPNYAFSSVGGRYVLMGFFGTAGDPMVQNALTAVMANRRLFDDTKICFFGISVDPQDREQDRLKEYMPGQRHFWDFDGNVSRLYGALPTSGPLAYRRFWLLLDPTLRVMKVFPFQNDGSNLQAIFDLLDALPAPERFAGVEIMAPVLYLPRVFEPEFCRKLIGIYEAGDHEESGVMREIDGVTKPVHDHSFKRRRDVTIEDRELIKQLQARVIRRIVPEVRKIHNFDATRMERYIVGCYTEEDGGHFRPHRDNVTKGTAHRRFAVSINLNEEFEGGELSFPEYGPRSFKPPVGGAVVFGCALLHAVSKITKGRRYAFLPFLYDDAAAKVRESNNAYLDPGMEPYKA
ncbi:2OG-Fe(II) oxygenase [Asticcacaulis biprosthecium]|uniref:2OG-Fe(II) oxygenase n=1 Tax=Asticcacaulis biprosthecium TaxID=76891 RepID=UPI000317F23C|nr:2OG-Fe(II) oxygenase [Asticcacaulis biprosthecium]